MAELLIYTPHIKLRHITKSDISFTYLLIFKQKKRLIVNNFTYIYLKANIVIALTDPFWLHFLIMSSCLNNNSVLWPYKISSKKICIFYQNKNFVPFHTAHYHETTLAEVSRQQDII